MSTDYYCKICDIPCTGQAPYDQHISSAKHLKKAKLIESQTSSEQSISTNINTSSPKRNTPVPTEDSSNSSPSVSISPETMRILLEWNHPLGYKPYCDICQLPLHGGDNADIHFRSNNNIHIQKLAAWKQICENDARYSCKVCSEIFLNENSMREHFNSDSHANMIQQKINLEKFIQIYETYKKVKQVRKQTKETSSVVDNTLANQFNKLNVIDGTESKPKSTTKWAVDSDKLLEILSKKFDDDDF